MKYFDLIKFFAIHIYTHIHTCGRKERKGELFKNKDIFSNFTLFDFFFFWPCQAACGISVPRPGVKPAPPALEALRKIFFL